ncbi:hypothetical protein EUX98_g5992 [Antrodiella citrinella]|uniref:Uncharacterized protein n=1 Tax=Antrodiella citrinella TaxID=2447956 RepID=A0A4S4MXQ4_9APHY|nr:hypothetical protein EUX98_g5992 [Antrodiella citrinella]
MRIELPVLSFLCVALITLLSPLHWKSRNVAVLSTIIWLFVANLIQGINSAIWLRDATARYPVWCDICSAVILHFGRSIKLSDGSRVHLNSVNFTFLRPLTTAILISLFVLFSSIFSLYAYVHAAGGLRHWSWSQVHATMSVVFVAESSLDLMRIEVGWWVTPVSTFVYFAMTVFGLLCGANDESVFGFSTVQRCGMARAALHPSHISSDPQPTSRLAHSFSPSKHPEPTIDTFNFRGVVNDQHVCIWARR